MIRAAIERDEKISEGNVCAHPGCTEPLKYWRCCATHGEPLAETRKIERPRLAPRPLPDGVRREGDIVYARGSGHGVPVDACESLICELDAEARDLLALVEWLRWQRAVDTQDGPPGVRGPR